jgi:putative transposase
MPNYRRVHLDGGCWFFTVNLPDRRQRLLTEHIGALREAVATVRHRQPFDIDAWVVLPDPCMRSGRSRPETAIFRRDGG